MKQWNICIISEQGIHARPASMIAKYVNQSGCKAYLQKDEISVNLANPFDIMGLKLMKNDKCVIYIDGIHEEALFNQIVNLF